LHVKGRGRPSPRQYLAVYFLSRHIQGLGFATVGVIAVILLWPMVMDRRQRWRNRRASKKF
jgi:membrane protein implicated in regulation of membrane protease activity